MSDARIQAAVGHWAPRMIANGIDYNDFVTTTARISRWEEWCSEWGKTAAKHEILAEEAEARGRAISAAEAWVRAALCHHFGKFVFFEKMDEYRKADTATHGNYRKAIAHLDPPAERVGVPYSGTELPGYLRKPAGVERPTVVLIICGLDSVKEEINSTEPVFHRRGMATLTLDGPGQGESEKLPIEPEFEKVTAAALDWLEKRRDVDGNRVGAIGVSLGGYYVARAAAFETRLRGIVPVGGPYDFGEHFDHVPSLTQQAFRFRSHSPDLAAARKAAQRLSLEGVARRIRAPTLVVFGRQDRLIPPAQAERLHAEIASSDKQLAMYEHGNHVVNNMPWAWRPLAADWLYERLRR